MRYLWIEKQASPTPRPKQAVRSRNRLQDLYCETAPGYNRSSTSRRRLEEAPL